MRGMSSPACPKIHAAVLGKVRTLRLPRGARVLDAPCGEGRLATALAAEGFEVCCADLSPCLAPEAQQQLGARFRVADLNLRLPWPDATFDGLLCVEGIEHLENSWAFLREARRVLATDGILLITTPNIASLRSRLRYFGSSFYTQDPRPLDESARHPLHHIGLRTFWEWRYALHTSGFELLEASHTHIKTISYAYAIYAPWTWIYTRLAFRKEKNATQRRRNQEIRRTLGSASLLFGENLLLLARRI
jgi:SAM-dependent methyltransferase